MMRLHTKHSSSLYVERLPQVLSIKPFYHSLDFYSGGSRAFSVISAAVDILLIQKWKAYLKKTESKDATFLQVVIGSSA